MSSKLTFRPRLVPTLAVLIILPLLLVLGFWQLDRSEQKRLLQQSFIEKSEQSPIAITDISASDPDEYYRRIIATGHYDSERQILLDNQVQTGRPGFHVYTPFKIEGMNEAILVNRGWVPLGVTRQQLPNIAITREKTASISGRIAQPANPGLLLDTAVAEKPVWPLIVQHIDFSQLTKILGYHLLSAVVLLDADIRGGYTRVWQPHFGGFGPERHLGYAVQWFALALTLVILYLVSNIKWRQQL
jgi:surfeit locus 1 family protein